MKESIYRTPRTYGSPTGYDKELSHFPDLVGRLAEHILLELIHARGSTDSVPGLVAFAIRYAEEFIQQLETRGHFLEVKDAPGMNKDQSAERGNP